MRLDKYLVETKLVSTRSEATDLIKRGLVFVDEKPILKAGFLVKPEMQIKVEQKRLYASRAGEKLAEALTYFKMELKDKVVVDVGASTGGFVDCVLNFGARHVYAYDVGTDQLAFHLKNNPLVSSFEQTNILDVLIPDNDLILVDVSFTSVKPIIAHIVSQLKEAIILLKPQFETEAKYLKKGILKDRKIIDKIMKDFILFLKEKNLSTVGFIPSALKGKAGNQEYLFYVVKR